MWMHTGLSDFRTRKYTGRAPLARGEGRRRPTVFFHSFFAFLQRVWAFCVAGRTPTRLEGTRGVGVFGCWRWIHMFMETVRRLELDPSPLLMSSRAHYLMI